MSYYVGLPLLLLLALVEAAVLPLFRVAGFQPNLVLVVLLAWIMIRGQREALVLIPVGGLFLGLVEGAPLGTALLALAPIAVIHELRGIQFGEGQFALTLVFTALATLAFNLTYLLVFTLTGEGGSWLDGLARVALPSVVLNCAVMAPIYGAIWLASGDLRRAAFA